MNEKINFKIEDREFYAEAGQKNLVQHVNSIPKPYSISYLSGKNFFALLEKNLNCNKNNLWFADRRVYSLYKSRLPKDKRAFLAPANEQFKEIDGVLKLVDFLQKNNFTKGESLIVLGGGTIQDVAAFSCAIYKRGISWIFFPTTLLAMCDSCIGGKTGINYHGAKNQLALFYSPKEIVINYEFLKTLSEKDISSGMGEVLKSCIIGGGYFLDRYEKLVFNGRVKKFDNYKELIYLSLSVKKAVVEIDEFELRYRRSLNYGHTVGHAAEVLSSYAIPHGTAVVFGMIVANEISFRDGILPKHERDYLKKLCCDLLDEKSKKILKTMSLGELKNLLKKDKKTIGNTINFVAPATIGKLTIIQKELNQELLELLGLIISDF